MKPIAIQSGLIYANETMPEWTLHRGRGERIYQGVVKFPKPFPVPPYVILSLYEEDEEDELDLLEEPAGEPEIPIRCKVNTVSEQGFEFTLSTWANHQVSEVTARWVAMAQTKDS